ncbi:TPA: hypothetical protein ACK1S3_005140, partial [Klebsiella quasipneumoniae]
KAATRQTYEYDNQNRFVSPGSPLKRGLHRAGQAQSSGIAGGAALARAYKYLRNCLIFQLFVGRVRRKPPPGRQMSTITKTGLYHPEAL